MKIKDKHYKIMKKEILNTIDLNPTAYAEYKKLGLSDTRYNFDLLCASCIKIYQESTKPTILAPCCLPLYDYMNDAHIATALKNITGKRG